MLVQQLLPIWRAARLFACNVLGKQVVERLLDGRIGFGFIWHDGIFIRAAIILGRKCGQSESQNRPKVSNRRVHSLAPVYWKKVTYVTRRQTGAKRARKDEI